LAYTTVLSLLQVMEQKRLVGHRASGKVYSYYAVARRGPTVRALARGFLDRVFDGAVDEYLVHALESKRPTDAEFRKLESLIAEAKVARQSPRKKGGKEESP
jgi:predicted transcriptional regulator